MAEGINIDVAIGGNLKEALDRGIAAGVDLTQPMKRIAARLASQTELNFEQERSPFGVPWQQSERAREEGGQTLTDSSDLRSSIRPDWGPDFAAAGPERSGGAAIYAAIHQFGGIIRAKAKKALSFAGRIVAAVVMPKREYLGFTEADGDFALRAIQDHLFGAFAAGGGSPALEP